jgi:hypothetical protein
MKEQKKRMVTRREFLGTAAVAAAFTIVPMYWGGNLDQLLPTIKSEWHISDAACRASLNLVHS